MKKFSIIILIILAICTTNCSQQNDNKKDERTNFQVKEKTTHQNSDYEIKFPDKTIADNKQEIIENKKELPQSSLKELRLPDWAKKIGITLPEGLKFVPELSQITEYNPDLKTVNTINLVFTGKLEKSLEEAEKIAKKANVPPSEDFIKAREEQKRHQEMLLAQGKKMEFPEMKGMIYTNSKPDQEVLKSLKYVITIVVEENGNLVINAVDNEQSQKLFNQ